MAFIPFIATGATMAYDQLVGKPEREKAASNAANIQGQDLDFRRQQWEEQKGRIDKQDLLQQQQNEERKALLAGLKSYSEGLPDTGYNQGVLNTKLKGVEQGVAEDIAARRPQILQNLATRGVRTSGISEFPLSELERQRVSTLGNARTQFTLEQLLADRAAQQAKQTAMMNYYTTALGHPMSTTLGQYPNAPDSTSYTNSRINEAYMPLYNYQTLAPMVKDLGTGLGYAFGGNPGSSASMGPVDSSVSTLLNRNLASYGNPLSITQSHPGAKTSIY